MSTVKAWVDESGSDQVRDPGTYILAATIVCEDAEPDIRDQMSQLRLPGQVKLHWRDESAKRKRQITTVVAAFDIEHFIVVRVNGAGDRPERARRKCLEQLLYELEYRGLTDVVMESRGRASDQKDIDMLNSLRSQHWVSSVRLTHLSGRDEAMLWIPDAVCGAITSAQTGTPAYQDQLEHAITLIEIQA